MVRAIAPPLMLYGVENIGISDTLLHTVRAKAAAAKGSATSGKSPDVSLAHTDGANGVADPAFEAHSNPLTYWSLVFWEQWFSHGALCELLHEAKKRVEQNAPTDWNWVRGPVTALVATMKRIKWTWLSATSVQDDIGNVLDFTLDPPSVFVTAARASVRRWRTERLANLFPQLVP